MFSPDTYWRLYALGNAVDWAVGMVATLAGLLVLLTLLRRPECRVPRMPWLGIGLAVLWLWVGWRFIWERYATINWAVADFAYLFFLQAALLFLLSLTVMLGATRLSRPAPRIIAVLLLAVALIGYPLSAPLSGRQWTTAEVFGIAPDPLAVATLALLVLMPRSWPTALLQAVPAIWLGFSFLTLMAMEAWQAWFTLAVLLVGFGAWVWPSGHSPLCGRRVNATAEVSKPLRPESDPTDCRSA